MVVYPRQVLGVPPGLIFFSGIGLILGAFVIGIFTGDLVQTEVFFVYPAVHLYLRRAYRDDPFIQSVWFARIWERQPWGPPFAIVRRSVSRMRLPDGVNRFS